MGTSSAQVVHQDQPILRERFLLSVVKNGGRDNPKIDFVATPEKNGQWNVSLMPFHSHTFQRGGEEHNRARSIQYYISHDLGYTLSGYRSHYKGQEMIFNQTFNSLEDVQASFETLKSFLKEQDLGNTVGTHVMFAEGDRAWKGSKLISQKTFN